MDDEEVGKADGSGADQTGLAMSQSASLRPTQALEKAQSRAERLCEKGRGYGKPVWAVLADAHELVLEGDAHQADHFDRAGRAHLVARLARKLDELGFDVTLTQRQAV